MSDVRYPIVLFDLDGTLIDSGAMILASFRHATRTVLERDIPDEELAALVGGMNIQEQMRTLDPDRVDELVLAYREHNEPLHADLQAFPGVEAEHMQFPDAATYVPKITQERQAGVYSLDVALLPPSPARHAARAFRARSRDAFPDQTPVVRRHCPVLQQA